MRLRSLRAWVLIVVGLLWCSVALPAPAATKEEKIFIYFVYDQGNPTQQKFINALYDRFKLRGFRDFLKKEGIAWVEGNYNSLGGVLNYLDLTRDDLIYFAVVTADKNERLIREIARTRISVNAGMTDKQMKQLADKYSNVFYYDTQNTLEQFHNGAAWARQGALINADAEAPTTLTVSINGKDQAVSAYRRSGIRTAMVPYDVAFFKQLGIDASISSWRTGNVVHLHHGATRLDFYAGSEIQDRKIYQVVGNERQFLRPIDPAFAYPELRKGVVYVPLHLALTRLQAPVDYKEDGDKVVLTTKK